MFRNPRRSHLRPFLTVGLVFTLASVAAAPSSATTPTWYDDEVYCNYTLGTAGDVAMIWYDEPGFRSGVGGCILVSQAPLDSAMIQVTLCETLAPMLIPRDPLDLWQWVFGPLEAAGRILMNVVNDQPATGPCSSWADAERAFTGGRICVTKHSPQGTYSPSCDALAVNFCGPSEPVTLPDGIAPYIWVFANGPKRQAQQCNPASHVADAAGATEGEIGEGLTTAINFTRERRCTLKDYFRIV